MPSFKEVLASVSKAEWNPTDEALSHLEYRSPWYDVANLLPQPAGAISPFCPFEIFPADKIPRIVRFLPGESVIALALTCKNMFRNIRNTGFRKLTARQWWRLILLLEQDLPSTSSMVACHACLKLHCGMASCYRRTYQRERWDESARLIKPVLPQGLNFSFCRLVMRRYLRQLSYTNLLPLAHRFNSPRILALPDVKISCSTTLRVVDGHFMVRFEALIAPFSTTKKSDIREPNEEAARSPAPRQSAQSTISGRAAYILNNITDPNSYSEYPKKFLDADLACPHQNCDDLEISFPSKDPSAAPQDWLTYRASREYFLDTDHFVTDHNSVHHDISRANHPRAYRDPGSDYHRPPRYGPFTGHHPRTCYGPGPVAPDKFRAALTPVMSCALLHDQPCHRCRGSSSEDDDNKNKNTKKRKRVSETCDKTPVGNVGLVRSCAQCFTDMCVSAQDMPGLGRVVSFTTWKDLGDITPELGLQTFFTVGYGAVPDDEIGRDGLVDMPRHRLAAPGTVYARFEGVNCPSSRGKECHDTCDVKGSEKTWVIKKWWWVPKYTVPMGPAVLSSGHRYTARIGEKILKRFMNPDLSMSSTQLEDLMY